MEEDQNVCEHCYEPAPEGARFCSKGCAECEHSQLDYPEDQECPGLCPAARRAAMAVQT